MRKAFVETLESLLEEDPRLALMLCDIGVFGFRKAFAAHPERVLNIGILEQATIGMAAGLASVGMIPVVHSIAPFLVERAFEQLKVDFSYQRLGGNFVSVGASHDYAALGCTHHCPGDVGILKTLPGFEIVLPGTAAEFSSLFRQAYANGCPTYFRLSERENPVGFPVEFGRAQVVRQGRLATVLALGTALGPVLEGVADLDVTILYYATASPFDVATLAGNCPSGKLALYEPCFAGALAPDALKALFPRPVTVDLAGQEPDFRRDYGRAHQHDLALGLSPGLVRQRVERLIHG